MSRLKGVMYLRMLIPETQDSSHYVPLGSGRFKRIPIIFTVYQSILQKEFTIQLNNVCFAKQNYNKKLMANFDIAINWSA